MIGKLLKKILGDKNQKDAQRLQPTVDLINAEFSKLASIDDNSLRAKSHILKDRIQAYIKEDEDKIIELRTNVNEDKSLSIDKKEVLFKEIDTITSSIDLKIEEILKEVLPEAFAIVKETARRWKENGQLTVPTADLDRQVAARRDCVKIDGDQAIWSNTWTAAGAEVVWEMVHYDVQLMGGIALHEGNIAEMQTGEGKTLVATLPVFLNALVGKGVHLVTVNTYLAKRDSEWMAPLYEFHGIQVDCLDNHEPSSEGRKAAYSAGITFGTNNEFGFDYLRDNMSNKPDQLVQKKHHYAIIDEVDSVLIDDARTPLIISGPTHQSNHHTYTELKPIVEKLVGEQRKLITSLLSEAKKNLKVLADDDVDKKTGQAQVQTGGIALLRSFRGLPKSKVLIKYLSEPGIKTQLQKVENFYLQDQGKEMPKVDSELFFVIDEKNNTTELTEKGIELISGKDNVDFFVIPDIGLKIHNLEQSDITPDEIIQKKEELVREFSIKSERIHTIQQLLKAYTLFEKEVEYVVMDSEVKIIDEQTGRMMDGRRYSDGLHQAIEAKENVEINATTQTYASITLQNFFRMYHKLSGMTGTAETEAKELWDIYELDVVIVPTNRPILRDDQEDLVFKTTREKYNAIIEEVERLTAAGRPVLVGTTTVDISELLSRMLKLKGIAHQVLNAKYHAQEAEIVAHAGKSGTVTIATNMAGRGTDIKLGEGVKEAGGLAIIGTERHDSRRVDRQLRGRAGRQGDPGSSQFYVSLEDKLMRLFGSERIAKLMDRMGLKEGEVIQHGMITKSIERAQKKVEENHFGVRKRLLEYDDVMNSQRKAIYSKRKNALYGDKLDLDIANMFYDLIENLTETHQASKDFEALKLDLIKIFGIESPVSEEEFNSQQAHFVIEKIFKATREKHRNKSKSLGEALLPVAESIMAQNPDENAYVLLQFSDGIKGIKIQMKIVESHAQKCNNVIKDLEKVITLAIIDNEWKEHLRSMDDLRQSVQQATYEQKDPLLVYKLESYDLFKKVLDKVNTESVSFLMKAFIVPIDNQGNPVDNTQVEEIETDTNEGAIESSRSASEAVSGSSTDRRIQKKTQPVVRDTPKLGRNDKITIFHVQSKEIKEVKFKVAEPMLSSGMWRIKEN